MISVYNMRMSIERPDNLDGKVIAVYGATSKLAIPFMETAAARGASIIAFARTPDKMSDELKNNPHVLAVTGDVTDPRAVNRAVETGFENFEFVDATVNFASVIHQSKRKIRASRPTNVRGEQNVLTATRSHGVSRHIYISSIAAMMRGGTNAYVVTKREAEEAVRKSGVTSVILRPANVVGTSDPNDIWNHPLVPIFRNRYAAAQFPLRRNGRFPHVSVETVTEATIAALEHGEGETIPLIDGYVSSEEYLEQARLEQGYEKLVYPPPWVYGAVFGLRRIMRRETLSRETQRFISNPPDIDLEAAARHLHVK